jgi:hypothetical protein
VQFTAPVSSGAREGPLVDSQSVHLGIISKRVARGPGGASAEAGFAVPIETVTGLAKGSGNQAPSSAAALPVLSLTTSRDRNACLARGLGEPPPRPDFKQRAGRREGKVPQESVERGADWCLAILRSGKTGPLRSGWNLPTLKTRLAIACGADECMILFGLGCIMEIPVEGGSDGFPRFVPAKVETQ